MTLTDLFIVYLSFGAPLAVYKYLQNRGTDFRRRVLVSVFTFFFWVPTALKIGYLYLTNAYSGGVFVSRRTSDAEHRRLIEAREAFTADLIKLTRSSNLHDLRETIERYVGLADEVRNTSVQKSGRHEWFEAAGRSEYELGRVCLMRRNLRRLQRHHIQARQDFVAMLEHVSENLAPSETIGNAIELARQLGDDSAIEKLSTLQSRRGEVWNAEQQQQPQVITPVSPLAMTASLNND